jgi:hypothetical protein
MKQQREDWEKKRLTKGEKQVFGIKKYKKKGNIRNNYF